MKAITVMDDSIVICDYYETGLLRNGEPLSIENLEGADETLKSEFNDWRDERHELMKPFAYTVGLLALYKPCLAELKYHNRDGLELAKRIRAVVGNDFKVYYSCIDISILLEQVKNK